jgi:ankyrin repeat protein
VKKVDRKNKMDKIYRDFKKAQEAQDFDIESYSESMYPSPQHNQNNISEILKKERQLSLEEKKFLLAAERGDIATVKYYLDESNNFDKFNMNAVDPLGRSAIHIAIEYENIEMIELLLNYHIDLGEALLHAINEEFVEAVEMLLHYQDNEMNNGDRNNQSSEKYEVLNQLFFK